MKKDIELILSDEFVAYSKKISSLHTQRKQLYDEFKKKLAEIDTKAETIHEEWLTWQRAQVANE